jgi:alkane 1-monooxygenase
MALIYGASFIPALLALLGNLTGGPLSLSNFVFVFGLMILLDVLSPESEKKFGPQNENLASSILVSHVLLHTLTLASLIYAVKSEILIGPWKWWGAISTGVACGVSGIIAAHELVHRRSSFLRALGIWNLGLLQYSHFYIEHIRVHHRFVGTEKDSATARFGESIFKFIPRSIFQQWRSSFGVSRQFVLPATILQISCALVLGALLGLEVFLAYVVCTFTAVLLLEYVNYIEHYGLKRNLGEGVKPYHSWQTNSLASRIMLLELTSHTDHHLHATKHYQTLEAVKGSAVLPYGYFGMFFIALIPPLWFRKINPLIEVYQPGSLVNRHPSNGVTADTKDKNKK